MSDDTDRGKHLRIGTSGWVYSDWRGVFYPPNLPQSRWYSHYARAFDTVEINYSFYRLPSEETFDHWREQAPEEFLYAVKANRYITHLKRLKDAAEPVARFLGRARRLGTGSPATWCTSGSTGVARSTAGAMDGRGCDPGPRVPVSGCAKADRSTPTSTTTRSASRSRTPGNCTA